MRRFSQAVLFLLFTLTSAAVWAGPVDINTANAETLARELNGVGQHKAQQIIEYRAKHGPFTRVEQLAEVKGIGLKTVERNRDKLILGKAKAHE